MLPSNQITPLDNQQKSPVNALHISRVEVPLPTAAPPEQLMDDSSPPPPRTEEEVVVGDEATIVEDSAVVTTTTTTTTTTSESHQVIDVGGEENGNGGESVKDNSHDVEENQGGHVNLDEMMISAPFESSNEAGQSSNADGGSRNELL